MTAQGKIEKAERSVYARLADARAQLHSDGLKKTGSAPNRRGGYFELGDFIVPAQNALRENGLVGVVSYDDGKASLEIVNVDDPSQKIVIASPLGSAKLPNCHEVQNIGAVQTYQRRYLWMTAMEIVEHDALEGSQVADDAAKGQSQQGAVSPPARISDEMRDRIIQLCGAVGGGQSSVICNAYKVESLADLTPSQGEAVISRLNEKLDAKAKQKEPA